MRCTGNLKVPFSQQLSGGIFLLDSPNLRFRSLVAVTAGVLLPKSRSELPEYLKLSGFVQEEPKLCFA